MTDEETLISVDISPLSTAQCRAMDEWLKPYKVTGVVRLTSVTPAGTVNTYFKNSEDAVLFRLTFGV